MINCPSCGSNFEGDLCLGCPSCGGRSVGPPLARPEHELPSYGRAVIVSAGGVAMAGVFLASVIGALIEFKGFPPRFGSIVNAGEVASWRLKWVTLPVAMIVLWGGARIIRSIKANPGRFIGLRAARLGFAASATVTVMIATLIGITVPVRLERRQWGIDAATYARGYTLHRALMEIREARGTLPDQENLITEIRKLPDPDGAIADALRYVDLNGYQATTMLAAASTKNKPLAVRGGALRYGPTKANAESPSVSFLNYELRLSSEHKLFSSDDDFVMRDGLILKSSDLPPSSSALTRPNTP